MYDDVIKVFDKTQGKGFNLKSLLGPMGVPNPYKIKDFLEKKIKGSALKVMTPDQMLQRLPIAIAQVEAGNNPRSLANEIRQMLYSLLQSGKITKKFYEGLMKTI